MAGPIIWTILSVALVIGTFMSHLSIGFTFFMILAAVACAVFQWVVYFRTKDNDKSHRL